MSLESCGMKVEKVEGDVACFTRDLTGGSCSVGLGPDNFLSVRTSGRRKNLGQNVSLGRPFFDRVKSRSRCGLSVFYWIPV